MAELLKSVNVHGWTKGDIMKLAYGNNKALLANVDVALPLDYTKGKPPADIFWKVMDYNKSVFGEIVNLKLVGLDHGVNIVSGAKVCSRCDIAHDDQVPHDNFCRECYEDVYGD